MRSDRDPAPPTRRPAGDAVPARTGHLPPRAARVGS
jgi:hypothetical protein